MDQNKKDKHLKAALEHYRDARKSLDELATCEKGTKSIHPQYLTSALSTEPRIRGAEQRSTPCSSARRTPRSPAAVTSSCRNIFTTLTDGMHCPRSSRNESSAARSCRTLNWTMLYSQPQRAEH